MVISANERLYHDRYNEADKLAATGGVEVTWPVPYWFVDAGALMMLVLLGGDRRRAGRRVYRPPRPEADLRRAPGLPPDVVPIGLALIGKPAVDPTAERGTSRFKERRRSRDDVVRWERWS